MGRHEVKTHGAIELRRLNDDGNSVLGGHPFARINMAQEGSNDIIQTIKSSDQVSRWDVFAQGEFVVDFVDVKSGVVAHVSGNFSVEGILVVQGGMFDEGNAPSLLLVGNQ